MLRCNIAPPGRGSVCRSFRSRDRKGVFHGPERAAKGDEDTAQPVWGQGFGPAAELPLGAELYVRAVEGSPVLVPTASSTERQGVLSVHRNYRRVGQS